MDLARSRQYIRHSPFPVPHPSSPIPRPLFRNLARLKTDEFLRNLYKQQSCLVLDVGARGGFNMMRALHEFQSVHSIEPEPIAAELLRSAKNGFREHFVHELALSDKAGQTTLHITRQASMSSTLAPDKEEFARGFGEMKNAGDWSGGMDVEKNITVEATTLASFCEVNRISFIDFLKLDTQGNELNILRGGEELLKSGKVGVLCVEVAFFPVYKGQSYFSDVDIFLRDCGFRFVECRSYPDIRNREDEFAPGSKIYERPKIAPVGDGWYVFNWDNRSDENLVQRKRSAVILATQGYFSEAKYLLNGIVNAEEMTDLFRDLSVDTKESGLRHFLRRWTPPAIQQWRAKRRK